MPNDAAINGGNGDLRWLIRVVLLAGFILSATLAGLGYNQLMSTLREIKQTLAVRKAVVDRKLEENEREHQAIFLNESEFKILMTMNFPDRMKALERIQKLKLNDYHMRINK